jgi:hypothetical protein
MLKNASVIVVFGEWPTASPIRNAMSSENTIRSPALRLTTCQVSPFRCREAVNHFGGKVRRALRQPHSPRGWRDTNRLASRCL